LLALQDLVLECCQGCCNFEIHDELIITLTNSKTFHVLILIFVYLKMLFI